jgi:ubiquinone/menaquinone biosynthesis C-methylase UbiE
MEAYKFTRADATDYEKYLGSVLFEPYGQYVASQIQPANLSSVIELACGTGRVTEQLYKTLPKDVEFWATDLSNDMLAIARRKLSDTDIKFQIEDIASLSYPDHSFDLVICQFGMMFLPDKQKGFDEVYRVLKPGGRFVCLTWDKVEHNPLSNLLINELIVPYFPNEDNARFYTPFSLHDPQQLTEWAVTAGFKHSATKTVQLASGAAPAEQIVTGLFLKHSLGNAVMEKSVEAFDTISRKFEEEIRKRFGTPASFPLSALYTECVK